MPNTIGVFQQTGTYTWGLVFDDEVIRYHQWWFRNYELWAPPRSGPHATIINTKYDPEPDYSYLKHVLGKSINVHYDATIHSNRESFWMNFYSARCNSIRHLSGLPPYHRPYFHITLGNFKNKNRDL